MQTLQQYMIPR
jgi:hypothetical protein